MTDRYDELDSLHRLFPELAVALDRFGVTFRNLHQEIEQLKVFFNINIQLSSIRDYQALLNTILRYARGKTDAEASAIFVIDHITGAPRLLQTTNVPCSVAEGLAHPGNAGLIARVITSGETISVANTSKSPHALVELGNGITPKDIRSFVCVPLRITRTPDEQGTAGEPQARIIGAVMLANKRDGGFVTPDIRLLERLSVQIAETLETAALYEELHTTFLGVVRALAGAIDSKDHYTHGHSSRVALYCETIGRSLNMSLEELVYLSLCAILHDVGKVGVPEAVLNKAEALTPDEFDQIKQHTEIGYKIMAQIPTFHEVARGLLEHHEKLDGTGYPRGLRSEDISIYAKIIAVADAFDAMTSDRIYRAALAVEEAFRRLNHGVGTQFDALAVRALEAAYARGEVNPANTPEPLGVGVSPGQFGGDGTCVE